MADNKVQAKSRVESTSEEQVWRRKELTVWQKEGKYGSRRQ
jgi:hypothetical protein